jgi:hypothetical protein
MDTALGVLVVAAAGLTMGGGVWPIKLMRKFQFEHWWFIGMLFGLIIMPWTITLAAFPNVFQAYRDVPLSALIISNLFAVSWGIANVLCGLCFVRIGVALTGAILTGLGASISAITPMIFKGSGLFKNAADVTSRAGLTIVVGIGVMLIGVVLASLAGFGRDRELRKLEQTSGSFLVGLIMTVVAGITSAGLLLAFVYSQGPIVARVSILESGCVIDLAVAGDKGLSHKYMIAQNGTLTLEQNGKRDSIHVAGLTAKAAADSIAEHLGISQVEADPKVTVDAGNIFAVFAVQAIGLLGGALINVIYPAYLMTKGRSWGILAESWKEFGLATLIGIQFCVAVALANKGMLLLGTLGASVGAGIQQAMQMVGGQGLGFISGEWRGVYGTPRRQMYFAIAMLIVAAVIIAYSNTIK